MDGTVKYVNLKSGAGGSSLPQGIDVGDTLRWNGQEWVPVPKGASDPKLTFTLVSSENVPSIVIPAAHRIECITFINSTEYDAQLSGSSALDSANLWQQFALAGQSALNPEGITDLPLQKTLSMSDGVALHLLELLENDNFNGAVFTVIITLRNLL